MTATVAAVLFATLILFATTISAIYIEEESSNDSSSSSSSSLRKSSTQRDLQSSSSSSKTYLVTFTDKSVSAAKRCAALAKSNGGSVKHVYDTVLNGCALTVPLPVSSSSSSSASTMAAQATMNALSSQPNVAMVELDQPVYALDDFDFNLMESELSTTSNNNLFAESPVSAAAAAAVAATMTSTTLWGLDRINQCALPRDNFMTKQDATGVTVFILDTGIQNTHVALMNYISSDASCHASFITGDTAFSDGNGHGTHVAGTTCGDTYGVSTNCKLCAVKVLDDSGSGDWNGVIAGINHVANKCSTTSGMKCVANMSLGGGKSDALNKAVADAVSAGVVMVVAAGNSKANACNYSPASASTAITVGSTTSTDIRSSFSNYGSCVDVYAPGTSILSSWIGSNTATATISGTSMASPHVAGIAAAILSANPTWTPAQVRNAIFNNAKVLSLDIGSGRLAVIDDITCSATVTTPSPTTKSPTASPSPTTLKPTTTNAPTTSNPSKKPTTFAPTTLSPSRRPTTTTLPTRRKKR